MFNLVTSKSELRPGILDSRNDRLSITIPPGRQAHFASSNSSRVTISPDSGQGTVEITADGLTLSLQEFDTELIVSLGSAQCRIPITVIRPGDFDSDKNKSTSQISTVLGTTGYIVPIEIKILDNWGRVLGTNWDGLEIQENINNRGWVGFGPLQTPNAKLLNGSLIDPTGRLGATPGANNQIQQIRASDPGDPNSPYVFTAINNRTITGVLAPDGAFTLTVENSH